MYTGQVSIVFLYTDKFTYHNDPNKSKVKYTIKLTIQSDQVQRNTDERLQILETERSDVKYLGDAKSPHAV